MPRKGRKKKGRARKARARESKPVENSAQMSKDQEKSYEGLSYAGKTDFPLLFLHWHQGHTRTGDVAKAVIEHYQKDLNTFMSVKTLRLKKVITVGIDVLKCLSFIYSKSILQNPADLSSLWNVAALVIEKLQRLDIGSSDHIWSQNDNNEAKWKATSAYIKVKNDELVFDYDPFELEREIRYVEFLKDHEAIDANQLHVLKVAINGVSRVKLQVFGSRGYDEALNASNFNALASGLHAVFKLHNERVKDRNRHSMLASQAKTCERDYITVCQLAVVRALHFQNDPEIEARFLDSFTDVSDFSDKDIQKHYRALFPVKPGEEPGVPFYVFIAMARQYHQIKKEQVATFEAELESYYQALSEPVVNDIYVSAIRSQVVVSDIEEDSDSEDDGVSVERVVRSDTATSVCIDEADFDVAMPFSAFMRYCQNDALNKIDPALKKASEKSSVNADLAIRIWVSASDAMRVIITNAQRRFASLRGQRENERFVQRVALFECLYTISCKQLEILHQAKRLVVANDGSIQDKTLRVLDFEIACVSHTVKSFASSLLKTQQANLERLDYLKTLPMWTSRKYYGASPAAIARAALDNLEALVPEIVVSADALCNEVDTEESKGTDEEIASTSDDEAQVSESKTEALIERPSSAIQIRKDDSVLTSSFMGNIYLYLSLMLSGLEAEDTQLWLFGSILRDPSLAHDMDVCVQTERPKSDVSDIIAKLEAHLAHNGFGLLAKRSTPFYSDEKKQYQNGFVVINKLTGAPVSKPLDVCIYYDNTLVPPVFAAQGLKLGVLASQLFHVNKNNRYSIGDVNKIEFIADIDVPSVDQCTLFIKNMIENPGKRLYSKADFQRVHAVLEKPEHALLCFYWLCTRYLNQNNAHLYHRAFMGGKIFSLHPFAYWLSKSMPDSAFTFYASRFKGDGQVYLALMLRQCVQHVEGRGVQGRLMKQLCDVLASFDVKPLFIHMVRLEACFEATNAYARQAFSQYKAYLNAPYSAAAPVVACSHPEQASTGLRAGRKRFRRRRTHASASAPLAPVAESAGASLNA